jgi:acetyl esterase
MSLNPELAAAMSHLAGVQSFAELLADPSGLDRLEAFYGGGLPYVLPEVPVLSTNAPGPNGPVPIRVYGSGRQVRPGASEGGVPGLVWLHGGGFAGGDLNMREADQVARELVERTGGVPHEDALAAWFWAVGHARDFGVVPRRLCLGGASAGANLAVGAAMYLKDIGEPLPAKMLLAYPFLHAGLPALEDTSGVMSSLPRILRFKADDCRAMVENYIGGPVSMASSYAVPGNGDPSGLPPTAIVACEYDDLRASAELFADSLRRAGIDIEFRLEEGATHGYLNHSAALSIVHKGLSFLAAELATAKPFQ